MKNVLELIRVSTERQAGEDRAGIPAQRDTNRRTCLTFDLTIVRTFELVDVSGTEVLNSPQMRELLDLMKSPDICGVVTKEFSRLFRPDNFSDYVLLQHFIDTKTVLYLPDGPIDLVSKSGRLLGTLQAALAGFDRISILERMNDAKESMRRAGKHAGGESSLPYGVAYSPKVGWSYTANAEKVRTAFRLFVSGETSYTVISQKLHIPRTNVRFILKNPIYAGWREYREKRDSSPSGYVKGLNGRQGYRRKVQRAPDEVIRVHVLDGIVSEEDFNRVQQIIESKRQKHWRARSSAPNHYTYNGNLICGDCGNLLYTHTAKDDYYICKSHNTREARLRAERGLTPCSNRYMLRKKLEPRIDHLLGEKLREPAFLTQVVDEFNSRTRDAANRPGVERSAIQKKLAALGSKRKRILEAFFEGVIEKDERDSRITEVDAEMETFQQILLDSTPAVKDVSTAKLEQILEPFGEWEFLCREDKRTLLADICPEIEVDKYNITSINVNITCNEDSRSKTA